MTFDHETYLSPLTWRYGSPEMRQIWSERHRRRLMRQVWLALATAQLKAGLVSEAQVAELAAHVDDVDIHRAQEIEREIHHDVMAEIRLYAEQCPTAGGIIHLGATSADITDNVDVLRLRRAGRLLQDRLQTLLRRLVAQIRATAAVPVMAFTHIQPAEPTSLGYRLAVYAQDLWHDWQSLDRLLSELRGKGFKGAVGTQASFQALLDGREMSPEAMEAVAMARLDLPYYPIATQTYSRQQDYRFLTVLAGLAGSLHKQALDFRLLQSPPFGEWGEPFGRQQVGSSAMPFKRNPILAENICSLARAVSALPAVAWANASQAILERSLDDSANRRLILPQACLLADELLLRAERLWDGMRLDRGAMARNLATYGPFAATERVLMALARAGADRQEAHEWLREASMAAWRELRAQAQPAGGEHPLVNLVLRDERLTAYLAPERLRALLMAEDYLGTAPARAEAFAAALAAHVGEPGGERRAA